MSFDAADDVHVFLPRRPWWPGRPCGASSHRRRWPRASSGRPSSVCATEKPRAQLAAPAARHDGAGSTIFTSMVPAAPAHGGHALPGCRCRSGSLGLVRAGHLGQVHVRLHALHDLDRQGEPAMMPVRSVEVESGKRDGPARRDEHGGTRCRPAARPAPGSGSTRKRGQAFAAG